MSEKKVSLGTVICLIIIFILIMCLAGMYVYYNFIPRENVNNEININENNNIENNDNINDKEQQITSLDINNQLVEKLYSYILKFNYYDETLVYQANKVTYSSIDNQLKLLTAFENLDESQAEKVKVEKNDPQYGFISGVEDDGNVYKYVYKKELIEQKVKEIFGADATVIHENCAPHDGYNRDYKNGLYTCYQYEGGGDVPWSMSKTQLIKAETDGNNIYVYDIYLHMVEVDNIINGINHYGTFDIYATSDRKITIANKIDLEEKGVYAGTENLAGEEHDKKYMSNILNVLGEDKIKTFKHTFTKDTNGNYNWVSTEIVD